MQFVTTFISYLFVFTLFVPTLPGWAQEQNCDCKEYIYLNETTTGGRVHKYEVAQDGSLIEIGNPWFDNTVENEGLTSPHGLGVDLNGFIYIGETRDGDIRRFTCDGTIIPESDFVIPERGYSFGSYKGKLYSNRENNGTVAVTDLCTGDFECAIHIEGLPTSLTGSWGLTVVDNMMYITSNPAFGAVASNSNLLWVVNLDTVVCDNAAAPIAPFITEAGTFGIGNAVLPSSGILGTTTDSQGNIYVVNRDTADEDPSVPARSARLLKYDSNGVLLAISDWDEQDGVGPHPGFTEPDRGYFNAIGIVYSETSDLLYVSTLSPVDDCVSLFDTNLTYLGASVPWTGTGSDNVKGISITKECCPTETNLTINTTICGPDALEKVFIEELYGCGDGLVCEGMWTPAPANDPTVANFETCDNSITFSNFGCVTYTKVSDGTGLKQCDAFSLTVTICYSDDISPPALAVNNQTCDVPGTFYLEAPCDGFTEFSTDGGTTWDMVLPAYDSEIPVTVQARCSAFDGSCVSPPVEVTSDPQPCILYDLALTKTDASPNPILPGGLVTFNITVENQGTNAEQDVINAQISEYPPAGWTLNDPNWPGGVYTIASLAAGESTTISVTLMAPNSIPEGIYTNYAEVTSFQNTSGEDVEDTDSNPDLGPFGDPNELNNVTDDPDDHDDLDPGIAVICRKPQCLGGTAVPQ